MNKTYFNNIETHIVEKLETAQISVYALLAWLTNVNIIKGLRKALLNGCKVNIVLSNSEWNLISKDNINNLIAMGAKFKTFGANESSNRSAFLHHKLCIIDEKYVLNGSFNYTNQATQNYESYNIKLDEADAKNCLSHFQTFWGKAEIYDWTKIEKNAIHTIKELIILETKGINPEVKLIENSIIKNITETAPQSLIDPVVSRNIKANTNVTDEINITDETKIDTLLSTHSILQIVEVITQKINPTTGNLETLIDKNGNPYYVVSFWAIDKDPDCIAVGNEIVKSTIFSYDGFVPVKGKKVYGTIETFQVNGEYPFVNKEGFATMVNKITVVALGKNPNPIAVANNKLKVFGLNIINKNSSPKADICNEHNSVIWFSDTDYLLL
jgi:PLD-like domain